MTIQKVLRKPIAVLGGGACAQTFAAELSLEGYDVRLFELPELAPRTLGTVMRTRRIELGGAQSNFKWFRRAGTARVGMVTTDMRKTLRGAGIVIVSLPAKGHKPFFRKMIPHMESGQVISIFPDNFGALMLRNMMRLAGCKASVILGGWSSMPYAVRMAEPGKLDCIMRTRELMGDALPSRDGEAFFDTMKSLPVFDGVVALSRADTVLGADLSNPNPVVHVPGSLLSVGPMEVSEMEGSLGIPKGKFSMYKHGMSPAVARVQLAFYREEQAIAAALGIRMVEYREDQFFWKGGVMGIEYWVPFVDAIMPPVTGPDSVEHRYFTEDIPVGTVLRYRLAAQLGIATPIIEALIRLGSIACKRDFLREGVSLKELGIEGLDKKRILRLVRGG
jgi:opine dehydrogenase